MRSSLDAPKPDEDYAAVDALIESVSRNPFVAWYFDPSIDFDEEEDIEDYYGEMPDEDLECWMSQQMSVRDCAGDHVHGAGEGAEGGSGGDSVGSGIVEMSGGVEAKTTSGGGEAETMSGDEEAETTSGGVEVNTTSGGVEAETSGGGWTETRVGAGGDTTGGVGGGRRSAAWEPR